MVSRTLNRLAILAVPAVVDKQGWQALLEDAW